MDSREIAIRRGLPILNLVAIVMLMVAVYGSPPYGFFLALKWVVVGACALNAWQLFTEKPIYIAVAWLLVASGAVQAFGSMRREEWPLFNWAAAILLAVSAVALQFSHTHRRSLSFLERSDSLPPSGCLVAGGMLLSQFCVSFQS